jgi:hypothetical protein
MRPNNDGAFGNGGWKGLHTGWGYSKPDIKIHDPSGDIGAVYEKQRRKALEGIMKPKNGGITPKFPNILDPRLTDPSQQLPTWDKAMSGLQTLKNGGTGNGKPVLVHKGEVIIKNPFRRGGGKPRKRKP